MESGIWSENHSAVAQESLGTSKGKETKVSKQIIYDLGLKPVERQPSKHSGESLVRIPVAEIEKRWC